MDLDTENPEDKNNVINKVTIKPLNSCDIFEISTWKNKKILITKPLLSIRIAHILWNGGGQILVTFYSVILKQRGLTLLEVSSIFSVIFLIQFAAASISGIIADKIGYAKPVLLFHIFGTLSVIICILLAPELRNEHCKTNKIDITCYNFSENYRNITDIRNFCSSCSKISYSTENIETTVKDFNHSDVFNNSISFLNNYRTYGNYSDNFSINLGDTLCFQNCSLVCEMYQRKSSMCLSRERILLPIYSVLVLCLFAFWSTGNRFFDFVVLSIATQYGSNFGKEAFIATIGEFVIVAIAAFALNIETTDEEKINYDVACWCCVLAIILTFIFVYITKDVKVPPGKKMKKKAWQLIRNMDTLVFIVVVFIAGNGFNFNVNFHLWFLETLNATKTVIGLHSLSPSLYGILVLLTSKWWIKQFGTNKIFIFGLLAYSIDEYGYSLLYNPWLSLLLETTTVFSYNLMWVALVVHSSDNAPEGFAATLNAIAGTVHYGIGRSTAILGGGLLMNYYGARIAYCVFASIMLVTAIFYSFYLCIRRIKATRATEKVDDDEIEEMKHMNCEIEQEV